jgi:hypothetical protein
LRSGRPLLGAIAVAGALALAGCGEDSGPGGLASLVPPDAPVYAEFVICPNDDQRAAIDSLSDRVAGIDDPGAAVIAELDRALAQEPGGFTYADDIEPWLGDRGAAFVRSFEDGAMGPDAAAMLEVTDTGAAQDFIERLAASNPDSVETSQSYEGVDYLLDEGDAIGLVDDVLVAGTEDSFKVVVDSNGGESLAEADEYASRSDSFDDNALATVYVQPRPVIEAALLAGDVQGKDARLADPLLAGPLSAPVSLALGATSDSATLDIVAGAGGVEVSADSGLLEGLPADSWLALAVPDLGALIQHALDRVTDSGVPGTRSFEDQIRGELGIDPQADVTSWLGDVAGFVKGTGVPGFAAGLIAESSAPEGPRKLVELAQELAEAQSGLRSAAAPEGADYGFSLGLPGIGAGGEVGVVGDRLVAALATSLSEVLSPGETLADDPSFQAAADQLGDDMSPALFLRVPEALQVAALGGDAGSPDYQAAQPYVEKIGAFVAGFRFEGGLLFSRLALTLAE